MSAYDNSMMDLYNVAEQLHSGNRPFPLTPGSLKVGSLFQITQFREKTECISVDWVTWYFKDFYCEVIEVANGGVSIRCYSKDTDESILKPGRVSSKHEIVAGSATLHFEGEPYLWFVPYSKLDLSRVNIMALDEDALIPEDLYK
jgi:hypothetical protein